MTPFDFYATMMFSPCPKCRTRNYCRKFTVVGGTRPLPDKSSTFQRPCSGSSSSLPCWLLPRAKAGRVIPHRPGSFEATKPTLQRRARCCTKNLPTRRANTLLPRRQRARPLRMPLATLPIPLVHWGRTPLPQRPPTPHLPQDLLPTRLSPRLRCHLTRLCLRIHGGVTHLLRTTLPFETIESITF